MAATLVSPQKVFFPVILFSSVARVFYISLVYISVLLCVLVSVTMSFVFRFQDWYRPERGDPNIG